MHTIEYFMWGYQIHFRVSAQTSAESVLSRLDPNLKPNVFLIGILSEDLKDRHPVCLEPEDCDYELSIFTDIRKQAEHYQATDPERRLIHSHPLAEENHRRALERRALQKAILTPIESQDGHRGTASFCSWPILVEGYMVSVVLQLREAAFKAHYSLSKSIYNDHWWIATSLLDATIHEFLEGCSRALKEPNPGASLDLHRRDAEEIIRAAGKTLMYTPASNGGDIMGLHGLYNSVNTISSMKYEGSDSFGSMIICRKGHPNIVPTVELRSPVPMSNPRAVRKLLETSSRDLSLLCDSANVYALGQTTGQYDSRNEDLFRINFTKHYTWELLHDGNALMRVVYAEPSLPRSQIDKDKFKDHLLRLFGNIDPKSVDMIWQLALEATRQKHGTMLVISAAAAAEAERLQAQSTRIQPVKLSTDLIRRLTMIDGAVLIAPDCTCYGIGVILDGLATKKGTPSRGARYNSAIRYIETIKSPTLAVVISEDGTIDLVPDLMPRISRLQISNAVEKLRKIRAAAQVDVKEFNQTMEWLREHSFYLQPKVCDEINTLRKEIEAHLEKNVAIRIIYPDFAPNEDFNESYFTD